MKKNKILIKLLLLILIIPFNTFALKKSETIYTNLNPDGSLDKSIVSNHLSFTSKSDINDNTILKNILNITGEENYLLKNNNKIIWTNNEKDIVYQGETNKKLPISVKVSYYLNDKEIKYSDLLNKSGKIKIKYSFTNNDLQVTKVNSKSTKLYTPFVVSLGTFINQNNNKNISISNGKVINTGDRNYLISIAAPGMDKNYNNNELKKLNTITISFETKNFSIGSTYIVYTPKLLEESDLSIFNKLDSVSYKASTLQTNMDKLEKGSKELEKATKELSNGTSNLKNGLYSLKEGISKLENGSYKTDQGVKLLISKLKAAKKDLTNNNLEESINSLNKLKANNTNAINNIVSKSGKSLSELNSLYSQYNLSTYSGEDELFLSIKSSYELIILLQKNNEAIDSTIKSQSNISSKINSLIEELDNALTQLESGTSEIYNGTLQLDEGINKIYSGSISLDNGTKKLNTGVKKIANGTSKLNKEGINKITQYTKKINNYSEKTKALIKLSKNYNGYSSNNANSTIFVSVIK